MFCFYMEVKSLFLFCWCTVQKLIPYHPRFFLCTPVKNSRYPPDSMLSYHQFHSPTGSMHIISSMLVSCAATLYTHTTRRSMGGRIALCVILLAGSDTL
jgi:hypothetical protein